MFSAFSVSLGGLITSCAVFGVDGPGELDSLRFLTSFTGRPRPNDGIFGGLTVIKPVSVSALPIGSMSSSCLGGEWIDSPSLLSSIVALLPVRVIFPSLPRCCGFLGVVSCETILTGLLMCFLCKILLLAVVIVCFVPLIAVCGFSWYGLSNFS